MVPYNSRSQMDAVTARCFSRGAVARSGEPGYRKHDAKSKT